LERAILPGDVVITMGAGDITRVGPELLAAAERTPTTANGFATAATSAVSA
jgi:hypothetical protein